MNFSHRASIGTKTRKMPRTLREQQVTGCFVAILERGLLTTSTILILAYLYIMMGMRSAASLVPQESPQRSGGPTALPGTGGRDISRHLRRSACTSESSTSSNSTKNSFKGSIVTSSTIKSSWSATLHSIRPQVCLMGGRHRSLMGRSCH